MSGFLPVRLAYNVVLPDEGVDESLNPIIFLHGLTAFKEHWDDVPKVVANETKRKVYAVDHRNHGDSEWSDSFNFDINADDVLHFMDEMDIKKAILVGHSMGGITSMKVALKKPDRVERLVTEDIGVKQITDAVLEYIVTVVSISRDAAEATPTEFSELEAKQFIVSYIFTELMKQPEHVLENFKRMRGGGQINSLDIIRIRRTDEGKYTFKANLDVIIKMLKSGDSIMSPIEGLYHGPTCFIYGDVSLIDVPGQENEIKKHFPNATLVGIKDATHTVHTDKPKEFTSELLKFLS